MTWMTALVLGTIGAVLIGAQVLMLVRVAKLRRSGRYPERGMATMADVERLMNMGSPGLAVRCYREIHSCSLRQATEAVQALSTKG